MADLRFIGRGWAFPPTFRKERCSVDMIEGKDNVQNSIAIILSTGVGERIMRPDFGANMERLLFSPLDATLTSLMRNIVEKAILFHEPRVNVNAVEFETVPEEGLVRILLDYTVRVNEPQAQFCFSLLHRRRQRY